VYLNQSGDSKKNPTEWFSAGALDSEYGVLRRGEAEAAIKKIYALTIHIDS
jgi:hypothetical protein